MTNKKLVVISREKSLGSFKDINKKSYYSVVGFKSKEKENLVGTCPGYDIVDTINHGFAKGYDTIEAREI